MTLYLIAIIAAVIFAVASPSGRDALTVIAFELGLGALAILVLAQRFGLVAAIPAIVGEVAQPLLWHASIISAFKVHFRVAFWTVLGTLVRTIATIVLAIAEQPLWNASVVCVAWTSLPPCRTVLLPTHVCWLVTIVAAIVI